MSPVSASEVSGMSPVRTVRDVSGLNPQRSSAAPSRRGAAKPGAAGDNEGQLAEAPARPWRRRLCELPLVAPSRLNNAAESFWLFQVAVPRCSQVSPPPTMNFVFERGEESERGFQRRCRRAFALPPSGARSPRRRHPSAHRPRHAGRRAQRRARGRAEPRGAASIPTATQSRPRRAWRARPLARSEHDGMLSAGDGQTASANLDTLERARHHASSFRLSDSPTLRISESPNLQIFETRNAKRETRNAKRETRRTALGGVRTRSSRRPFPSPTA